MLNNGREGSFPSLHLRKPNIWSASELHIVGLTKNKNLTLSSSPPLDCARGVTSRVVVSASRLFLIPTFSPFVTIPSQTINLQTEAVVYNDQQRSRMCIHETSNLIACALPIGCSSQSDPKVKCRIGVRASNASLQCRLQNFSKNSHTVLHRVIIGDEFRNSGNKLPEKEVIETSVWCPSPHPFL